MGRQRVAVWVNEERYKQGNETITSCGTVVVLCIDVSGVPGANKMAGWWRVAARAYKGGKPKVLMVLTPCKPQNGAVRRVLLTAFRSAWYDPGCLSSSPSNIPSS